MATKETLEAKEGDCSSAADFVALAREALADPADLDYAKDLLEKGELECQFPGEYVAVAEAAKEAGLDEYAGEVYEQAEEACFEAMEFAELGRSLGVVMGDREKAREMLEKAAEEAKAMGDLLKLSQSARDALGDEELAASLLEKVEGDCRTLEDYKKLAGTVLKEAEDVEAARAFYKKGEKFAMDLDSTIAYAEGIGEIFDDKEWIGETLEEVESDCQFTKEFVTLAGAYKRLTGDDEKVGELMEQAEEFAMTGEEQVQLAEGAFHLLGDKEKAKEAYEKALSEITDRDQLFGLAATIAKELGETDLAKTVYAKAEEKITGVADACKLARAAVEDLGDREFAAEVYGRAEEKFSSPADARTLAADVLEVLEDKERAGRLFGTCLEGTEEFAELKKLLAAARSGVDDPDLNRAILEKLAGSAKNPTQYIDAADQIAAVLEDRSFTARMLDEAEERVSNLPEMKAVVAAVGKHLPDDADRVARVAEKLEKREANQARYDEFQKREGETTTARRFLDLTREMMEDLDDRYYAAKLLGKAQDALDAGSFDAGGSCDLVLAVERYTGDRGWVESLLEKAGERAETFADVRTLCRLAVEDLEDKALGGEWAKTFLAGRQEAIAGREDASPYEFTKLAGTVHSALGDAGWSGELLGEAEARARTHLELSHVAKLRRDLGDTGKAAELVKKAAGICASGPECIQLISTLRDQGIPDAELRGHYETCGRMLAEPVEKIRWAEGILMTFGDRDWAQRAFTEVAPAVKTEEDRQRFTAVQKLHFGKPFC